MLFRSVSLNRKVYDFSNIELIKEYFKLEKKLNKSPLSSTDMDKYSKIPVGVYRNRFGSWKNFLKSIELKPVSEITKDDLIKEYYRIKNTLKVKTVTGIDFIKYSKYTMGPINRIYGGWINFLKELNEDDSYYYRPIKEELIAEYFRVKKLSGKEKVFAKDMLKYGKFGAGCYNRCWGSWSKFLNEIDKEQAHKKQISDNQLIEEYYNVKNLTGKKYISVKDMEKYSKYSIGPYFRFGSWNNFLKKIGENIIHYKSKDVTPEDLINDYMRVSRIINKEFPSVLDIRKHGIFKVIIYENKWGKWSKFIMYYKSLEAEKKNNF